jgi:hypothetical protein
MLSVALLVSLGVATPVVHQPMSYDPARMFQGVANQVARARSWAADVANPPGGRKMSEEEFDLEVCGRRV